MKTLTLIFDQQRLSALEALLIAAGKSPSTGPDGMVAAVEMLGWIGSQLAGQNSPPASEAPIPPKPVLKVVD